MTTTGRTRQRVRGGTARWVSLVAFALIAAAACSPPPAPGQRYRVPATFNEGLLSALLNLAGPPPGANLPDCRPTAQHPRPVILLHGIVGNMADNMNGLAPQFANLGYCVFAMTYGATPGGLFGGLADIRRSALEQIGPFIDQVLNTTGARQVDIIGHSEGSVTPRWWMRYGDSVHADGSPKVANFVGIGPASNGADLGGYARQLRTTPPFSGIIDALANNGCAACEQVLAGSELLRDLNTTAARPGEQFSGPVQPGVRYLMLATEWDNFVIPYQYGFLDHPAVKNLTVQQVCDIDQADHLSIVFDPVAYDVIANFLDPQHPVSQRCVPTRPALWPLHQFGRATVPTLPG